MSKAEYKYRYKCTCICEKIMMLCKVKKLNTGFFLKLWAKENFVDAFFFEKTSYTSVFILNCNSEIDVFHMMLNFSDVYTVQKL